MNPMGARQATITLVYLSSSMEIELLGEQNSSCFMLFDRAETQSNKGFGVGEREGFCIYRREVLSF